MIAAWEIEEDLIQETQNGGNKEKFITEKNRAQMPEHTSAPERKGTCQENAKTEAKVRLGPAERTPSSASTSQKED